MKALVFAAGRGERMRPLTEHTPKPLLEVGGRALIEWHLLRLAAAGFTEAVVNIAHLGDKVRARLGDGARYGLKLAFSDEGPEPLETGGGMLHALARLGTDPFIAVNADIWTDHDFGRLRPPRGLAHLVLVDNPPQHRRGDFLLHRDATVHDDGEGTRLTFAGIGVYRPALLDNWRAVIGDNEQARRTPPAFPLAPLLRAAMRRGEVSGEHHGGVWSDVGTVARLEAVRATLAARS